MVLQQHFARQRRPKIDVVLAHQLQSVFAYTIGNLIVGSSPTGLVDQRGSAAGLVSGQQTLGLPDAHCHNRCRRLCRAATGYDLLKALKGPDRVHIDSHGWVLLAIGFVISFIVAYGVVAWFMQWVRNRGFVPFAIYRILVGAGVLLWVLGLGR